MSEMDKFISGVGRLKQGGTREWVWYMFTTIIAYMVMGILFSTLAAMNNGVSLGEASDWLGVNLAAAGFGAIVALGIYWRIMDIRG